MLDPNRPYNELPALPPNSDVETRAILKKWGLARTALAEMRLAGPLIPDPGVLISSIPLLEAKDSSEIENIVTTNDALFREASLGDEEARPRREGGLRYRTALYHGLEALKTLPLSTRIAVRNLPNNHWHGNSTFAQIPGTLTNRHTGEVIYTPPEGEASLARAARELGAISSRRTRWHRPAHTDGRAPLPVRGHPSFRGRQRPNRSHPQCPLPDPGTRLARSAYPLSQPPHPADARQTTIACWAASHRIKNGSPGYSTCSLRSR